jgi:hypothetical protein
MNPDARRPSEWIEAAVAGDASAASALYELVESDAHTMLSALLSVLSASPTSVSARLCLICLSRIFSVGAYDQVDPAFDDSCQASLFAILRSDVLCMDTYSTVAQLLARAARYFSERRPWPGFAAAIAELCSSPNDALATAALDCVLQCA